MLRLCFIVCMAISLTVGLSLRAVSAEELPTETEVINTAFSFSEDQLLTECYNCNRCSCSDCNCHSHDSIWSQPFLTGNWNGLRPHLKESGITFRGNVTQFGFGVAGGINSPVPSPLGQGDTFKYTGRGEYDLIFDLEKFGGLPKGKLLVGAQHWWGEFGNVSFNTGALNPAIFSATQPPAINDPGVPFLTDFLFTQPISENLVLFAGKKNIVGTSDQDIFAGGDGTDQFMNQALIANPAYLLALPFSSFTAGVVLPAEWGLATIYVWDPQDRTTDGLNVDGLFSKGIILGSQIKVNTNFFNKPGEHHIGGIWKHVDLIDLSGGVTIPPPSYPYPPAPPEFASISDSFTIYYGFDQYLQVYPGKRQGPLQKKLPRGWGLFGRASVSDGNPTPFNYFLSLGIGGDSRIGNDRGDTFGLGWYYNGVSDEFGPVAQTVIGPRDGTGVELYYKCQLTPWLAVTPDLQYIRPGFGAFTSGDDAFIYGVRVDMKL
jgi:porin